MKKIILIVFLFYLFFPSWQFFSSSDQEARLIFFDVGQGDATLLISPQGKTLLIDGGPDKKIVEKIARVFPRKKTKIDWVILSHDHDDHYTGLIALLDYYSFSHVIGPNWSTKESIIDWWQILDQKNSHILKLDEKRHRFALEPGCYFDVIASPLLFFNSDSQVSANDSSFSVKIDCFGIKALLTGDLEKKGEEALLDYASQDFLSAEIFKAGHHGSNTSNNLEFLQAIKPRIVVIPVGADNSYGHPGRQALNNIAEVGAQVLRSDFHGDIEFLANKKEILIKTEF